MTKLDYERARGRNSSRSGRSEPPLGPAVRPARSGKRYDTFEQAANAARYVNDWGRQRNLYEWFVKPTDDGEKFELWRRPRRQAKH